jgi:adenine-specific DNA-methyltransferase
MYFTEENAAKIDGVRERIATWARAGRINSTEEVLLVADLLIATNRVANIAGTYGCFLRQWVPSARAEMHVRPRKLFNRVGTVEILNVDVADLPVDTADVAYFDPPYTKRQYAAYYHVLETLALGDKPAVDGITGLRPWRAKASDFCYRSRALGAIRRLVERTSASRVYLSYSSEGHVRLDALERELAPLGRLTTHLLAEIGRYRPNRAARDAGSSVAEYLLELRKAPRPNARP